jgi:hypothetical protein
LLFVLIVRHVVIVSPKGVRERRLFRQLSSPMPACRITGRDAGREMCAP